MTLKIIGAGMAGLLAAHILRDHNPIIIEASSSIPHNHKALLRFRTPAVGEALGIEFKKVTVIKAVEPYLDNAAAAALAYSYKNTGTRRSDRSITAGNEVVERWIAPPDLIGQMVKKVEKNGTQIILGRRHEFNSDEKVLSTIPMPSLMEALDYPGTRPAFQWRPGVVITATIENCDAYVSLAVPDPLFLFSRVSITGDQLIIEIPRYTAVNLPEDYNDIINEAISMLGIGRGQIWRIGYGDMPYAKILPIDEHERKSFIYWASTVTGQAFSLGRFATWRPGLLMDDLLKDLRLIDSWIRSGTPGWAMERHHVGVEK